MTKLPGKTIYSGRRRTTTRSSGFKSHPDSTGGEFQIIHVPAIQLEPAKPIDITFTISPHKKGTIIGFGGWYCADEFVSVDITTDFFNKFTKTLPSAPNWSKLGSIKVSPGSKTPVQIKVSFKSKKRTQVAFYNFECGIIHHKHLDWAIKEKPNLMKNMYTFVPETNFIEIKDKTTYKNKTKSTTSIPLYLKSCNRCARFLPINIDNERTHLSFANHCVAEHRRPCSHTGFGKLKNLSTSEIMKLEYGYQLECRYCKKFEVNAAHNPQRTSAQMKEDGARRRSIELLLTELYGQSPQLRYRHITGGRELTDEIWEKFGGNCFNCSTKIKSKNKMHLDHTRPLAMLWPIDGTATCLCGSCNSQKRDRAPVDFYSKAQLLKLSKIVNIPIKELTDPAPNNEAVNLLVKRLDWFFGDFCMKPELNKVRDGKLSSELLIKALQKTLNKCAGPTPVNLQDEYNTRLNKKPLNAL